MLSTGCDKVAINSAAVKNPALIKKAAEKFGSQCIVVAIDAKLMNSEQSGTVPSSQYGDCPQYEVFINGGRIPTGLDAIEWAKKVEDLGAGEILLTSMDRDGTKDGYEVNLTKAITEAVNIPVIASGGAGELKHFSEVIEQADADAVLAASLFHFGELSIKQVKDYLSSQEISVRK
jgi:cyclase